MANNLELSDLLDLELRGKKTAMGRYDGILWKIRSGYLVVLAGALGFLVTEDSPIELNLPMLIVILWFSAAAWSIDVVFRRRQLRVVKAYNELVTAAIENMPGGADWADTNLKLFHISGETLRNRPDEDIRIGQCMTPSIYIYPGICLLSFLLYVSEKS